MIATARMFEWLLGKVAWVGSPDGDSGRRFLFTATARDNAQCRTLPMALAGRSNGTMLLQFWEPTKREEKNVRASVAPVACRSDPRARLDAHRRCGRAQFGSRGLQAARPDQMESTQRRRLAKLGAGRRPVQAGALCRAQQMAEGKPFQPSA